MRSIAVVLTVALSLGAGSCADMPTAPRAIVHVEGRVVERDGQGVAGVRIYLTPLEQVDPDQPPGPWFEPAATSDSEGMFRVDLAEGGYQADLFPTSQVGMPTLRIKKVEVSPDAHNPTFRFTGSYLYGHVSGPNGAELPSVAVDAYNVYVGTGAGYAGSSPFRLLLSPGTYRMRITGGLPSGLPSLDTTVVVPDHDDSLHVTLTGHLVNVHVTTNSSTPIPGAVIQAQSSTFFGYSTTSTDLNGDATLYLRTGGYTLVVNPSVPGMVPWSFFEVIQDDIALNLDLTPVRWSGTVRSSMDNSPIPFAYMNLREMGIGYNVSTASSDYYGNFELLLRPGAAYEVRGYSYYPRFSAPESFVSLGADSTFDLYLNPEPATTLSALPVPSAAMRIPRDVLPGR